MTGSPLLKSVLFISFCAILLFPLYAVFVEYPSFEKVIARNTSQEAIRIATILSSVLINERVELRPDRLPKAFLAHIQSLQKDTRVLKLKIFNTAGTVVYSTASEEIGRINEEDYFRRVVTTGGSKAQEIPRNELTLESQQLPADVVETYVPIMHDRKMIGVFEIYYDISAEKDELRSLIRRSTAALFAVAAILLLTIGLTFQRSRRLARDRKRMEDALIESEQRYRTLFEHAGDAIFILDSAGENAGRIIAANRAAAAMHGYPVEELQRLKIMDLDSPASSKNAPLLIDRILAGEWVKAELTHRRKDGTEFPVEVSAGLLELGDRKLILAVDRDITGRRQIETARENLIRELKEAFDKIKTLKGLLPICASCKKIRDDKGYWSRIEEYIGTHTDAEFTHGICPDCMAKLYPDVAPKKP
ncbi:MAG: PAS domain-containing protein [Nitrospirota bacterium]